MPASLKRAKITTTPAGKTKITPAKPRRSVSAAIGAEKSAERKTKAWTTAAKGRSVAVKRKGAA